MSKMYRNRNCVIGDHSSNSQQGHLSNRSKNDHVDEKPSPRHSKETLSRRTKAINKDESFGKEFSFGNRKPGIADPRFWRKNNLEAQGEHLRNSGSKYYMVAEKEGKLNLNNNVQQCNARKRVSRKSSVCSDKASQTKKMEPVNVHLKTMYSPNSKDTYDPDENIRRTKNMYTLSRSQSCSTFDHKNFFEDNCDFEHTAVNNSVNEAERTTRWVDQTIFIKSLSPSVSSLNSDIPVKLEQEFKPIFVEERCKTMYLGKANSVVTVVGASPELFMSHRILPGSLNKKYLNSNNKTTEKKIKHNDRLPDELNVEISGTDMTPSLSPSDNISKFTVRHSQRTLCSPRDSIKKEMTPTWKCSGPSSDTVESEKLCSNKDCLLCQLASKNVESKTSRDRTNLSIYIPSRWLPWRSVFWLTVGGVTFWVTSNFGCVLWNITHPPEDDSVIESVVESLFDFVYRIALRPRDCRNEDGLFFKKNKC